MCCVTFNGHMKNAYKIPAGELQRRSPVGRLIEDNIKINLK
jgi:hypothetical protein